MARLDRLPPAARSVALVASVLGREFDRALLREVTGGSASVTADALERLRRAQLVVASGVSADGFLFRHALIQDTAYRSLLARTRRRHHERIAEILIARRPEMVERQPEVVARHFTEAGRGDKALAYWHRAARRSLARAANHEAVSHSEQMLAIASELTDPEARKQESLAAQLVLGVALANLGRLWDALTPLQSAIEAADRRGESDKFVEGVLELDTTYFLLGDGNRNAIGLLQKALTRLRDDDHRTRCQIMGRLARAMLLASDAVRAAGYNREASQLARRIGDDTLLFDVLVNDFLMPASTRPEAHLACWRERMDELCALALSIGDDSRGRAFSLDVYVSAEMGDRARMDAALERLWTFSQERQRLHVQWIATHGSAMRAIMSGDFASAERFAELGWDLGHRTHGGQFEGVYGIQMFAIRREQGRLAEVAPVIKRLVDDNPDQPRWKPGFALVACELGFKQPAQRMLDELAATGFTLPLDAKHSTTLAYLAEVCVELQDERHAHKLYELLLPYRYMTVTAGVTTVCYGAAGRFLGALAGLFGNWAAAETHFEQAVEMNRAMAAPPWLAHTQCAYADMLRRRGHAGDGRRADALLEEAMGTAAQLQMVALKRRLRRFVH
jgi:tetratricopeptide (TPR) repeat protein